MIIGAASDDSPFEPVLDCKARLAEGPVWDSKGHLHFTDITGKKLHCFTPATGVDQITDMPEEVGCFAPCKTGGMITATRSGIWLMNDAGRHKLAANPENTAISRFNDGTVDPAGRFLAGTVDQSRAGLAGLYRYDKNGLALLQNGLMTSNGLAFSPDGKTLYHSDTPRFTVYAYDYDMEQGTISNKREFLRFAPTDTDKGRPDGAAVDAEGCYWTALFEGGRIERYSPKGELLASLPLPAPCPTMVCFGGDDLKTLFVTTAREGRTDDILTMFPASGGIFSLKTDVPGLLKPVFDPER